MVNVPVQIMNFIDSNYHNKTIKLIILQMSFFLILYLGTSSLPNLQSSSKRYFTRFVIVDTISGIQ
jgi:hypothetical protein